MTRLTNCIHTKKSGSQSQHSSARTNARTSRVRSEQLRVRVSKPEHTARIWKATPSRERFSIMRCTASSSLQEPSCSTGKKTRAHDVVVRHTAACYSFPATTFTNQQPRYPGRPRTSLEPRAAQCGLINTTTTTTTTTTEAAVGEVRCCNQLQGKLCNTS
ncbi:uncharacterized protein B0I36DRAFT_87929 [Microdochium trichocladiopsis]|uniref:Uncharacterized protein n=1 Tax=Microdochium trichocladiopsis TaxID=1682393 RepID=A0A9P8YDS1_9PEZI|nr:uncharacterized protein B0I36DRAFT_87929 [Microdochium trichocladiopsis]KAH7035096.1 hypothetical protein B0I36DRAFT_87929 [Microdochium trichocladiopsis]